MSPVKTGRRKRSPKTSPEKRAKRTPIIATELNASEKKDLTCRLFKFLIYEDIAWDRILKGRVKCTRCIELMKVHIFEQNLDFSTKLSQHAAEALGLTLNDETSWAKKFAAEFAALVEKPKWVCRHVPVNEGTYFVDAIKAGVKQLMENYD